MNDLVVQALQAAIAGTTDKIKPDLCDWREGRIAELEATIRDFCEYVIDTGCNVGMPAKFHARFRDLCEAAGFDADEHAESGFDRGDV